MDRRVSLRDVPVGFLMALGAFAAAVIAIAVVGLLALVSFDLVVVASSGEFGAARTVVIAFFVVWFFAVLMVALGPVSGRPKTVALLLLFVCPLVSPVAAVVMLVVTRREARR